MSLSDWMPKRYVKTHTGKGRNKGSKWWLRADRSRK